MDKFKHIDTWIFDLDNTLYDAEAYAFPMMSKRMTDFVAKHLGVPHDKAATMREGFFQKYGTTLRGLMSEHGVEPEAFLRHAHDFDLSPVPPCAITQEHLTMLPGRKIVFTNSPRHFARAMTAQLGIATHFEDIFAIEDAGYWPKPDPRAYNAFLQKHGVDPRKACMFEDMEINLKTAHDLGMSTVWLHGKNDPHDHPHVHHKAEKLPHWLQHTLRKK